VGGMMVLAQAVVALEDHFISYNNDGKPFHPLSTGYKKPKRDLLRYI
jgi:hypothetical protein